MWKEYDIARNELAWLDFPGIGIKFKIRLAELLTEIDDGYSPLDVEWHVRAGTINEYNFGIAQLKRLVKALDTRKSPSPIKAEHKIIRYIAFLEEHGYEVIKR